MLRRIRLGLGRSVRGAVATSLFLASAASSAVQAAPPGDIVLGDITVMRLTTAVGNTTAEQRASLVQDRINQAISIPNVTEKDVHLVVDKAGPTIYVQKIKIVTIDPATATAQGVTPLELAKTWTHRLMGVIAQVCIRVPVTPPTGGPQIAAAPGSATAGKTDPTAAVVSPTAAPPATVATSGTPVTPVTSPTSSPAPAAPATPLPATPAQQAAPAVPVDQTKPAPPTTPPVTPANPTTPPTPVTPPAPANPSTTPPAPVTPPVPPGGD